MKIGNAAAGIPAEQASAPLARTSQEAAAKAQGAAESSATVELSNTAATLISGATGAPVEFDAAKVERIGQAIANGTFKINAEAIADKLIGNAQELLGKVNR